MTKTQAVDIHGRSYHRTIMFVLMLMLIATLADAVNIRYGIAYLDG